MKLLCILVLSIDIPDTKAAKATNKNADNIINFKEMKADSLEEAQKLKGDKSVVIAVDINKMVPWMSDGPSKSEMLHGIHDKVSSSDAYEMGMASLLAVNV